MRRTGVLVLPLMAAAATGCGGTAAGGPAPDDDGRELALQACQAADERIAHLDEKDGQASLLMNRATDLADRAADVDTEWSVLASTFASWRAASNQLTDVLSVSPVDTTALSSTLDALEAAGDEIRSSCADLDVPLRPVPSGR